MKAASGGMYGIKIGNLACFCGHRPDTVESQEISLLSVHEADARDSLVSTSSGAQVAKIKVLGRGAPVDESQLRSVPTGASSQPRELLPPPSDCVSSENTRADVAELSEVCAPAASPAAAAPKVIHTGRSSGSSPADANERAQDVMATLYLNILIVSKGKGFQASITEGLKGKLPNPFGRGGIERFVGFALNSLVGTDKIAAKMAAKMSAMLPQQMGQMGISADAEEVFRKGAFVVLRIKVIHCDLRLMIAAKAGDENARRVDRGMGCLKRFVGSCCGRERVERTVDKKLNEKVIHGMSENLGTMLPQKMAEKGLEVDVVAKSEEAQAEYFFDFLTHLNSGSTTPGGSDLSADHDNHAVLYLNILIASKTEQFEAVVTEKLKDNVPNPFGRGGLQRLVGSLASAVVSTDAIAAKLAQKMPESLPSKMAEIGIQADAKEVFREGAFVVVKISIINCDVHRMIAAKAGEEKAQKVDKGLGCAKCAAGLICSKERMEKKLDSTVRKKVVQSMCRTLHQCLPQKMAEKGLIVDVVAKSEEEQAEHFFNFLKSLDHPH